MSVNSKTRKLGSDISQGMHSCFSCLSQSKAGGRGGRSSLSGASKGGKKSSSGSSRFTVTIAEPEAQLSHGRYGVQTQECQRD